MTQTFVYGTPRGFNFYEGDAAFDAYFKSFYVSSRKGRRLMVHRRPDGTTAYSFLCYGVLDNGGRINAFFGCTLVLDDGTYAPSLKTMYDWMDYLVGKLVERGGVMGINDGGMMQYRIDRFSDASDDIGWLKANLPNILRSTDFRLEAYDSTFSDRNSGSVVCRHYDTPDSVLQKDLRRVRWVALSPAFPAEEFVEEINFADLDTALNGYNQSLLKIALDPKAEHLQTLAEIQEECAETLDKVAKYRKYTDDVEEQACCDSATQKYHDLSSTVGELVKKATPKPKPVPPTPPTPPSGRHCAKCGQLKPAWAFNRSKDVCDACLPKVQEDPQAPAGRKKCVKCHELKPAAVFTKHPDICDQCLATSKPERSKQGWMDQLSPATLAASAIVLVIVVISAILIGSGCPRGVDADENTDSQDSIYFVEGSFDERAFETLLLNNKFDQAFDSAHKYNNKAGEKEVFNAIGTRLVEILTGQNPQHDYNALVAENPNVVGTEGFKRQEKDALAKICQDLRDKVAHGSITEGNRKMARAQVQKLVYEVLITHWAKEIDDLKEDAPITQSQPGDDNGALKSYDIKIEIEGENGWEQLTQFKAQNKIIDCQAKKKYRISNDGSIKMKASGGTIAPINKKPTGFTVEMDGTPVTFTVGEYKITLNPTKNAFYQVD